MSQNVQPLHVSIIAFPDAVISTLTGVYDVLNSFGMLKGFDPSIPEEPPFRIEIVGASDAPVLMASGVPVNVHKSVEDIEKTDIIIAPSVLLEDGRWRVGRYPDLVRWISEMHKGGAQLCSACSGVFLFAETGLFDGQETTIHWGYQDPFEAEFPNIPLSPERVLIVSGARNELITSGAAMSWHDLVLYLIALHIGAGAAQAVARFFALQWHHDGITPYVVFNGGKDHEDATIFRVQNWIAENFAVAKPVEEMIKLSKLPTRSFKRRFKAATGLSALEYTQRLRVEDAKRRLELDSRPIDEIAWRVGYEDPAFFRRLFKRSTGLSPGAYRKQFCVPAFVSENLPNSG